MHPRSLTVGLLTKDVTCYVSNLCISSPDRRRETTLAPRSSKRRVLNSNRTPSSLVLKSLPLLIMCKTCPCYRRSLCVSMSVFVCVCACVSLVLCRCPSVPIRLSLSCLLSLLSFFLSIPTPSHFSLSLSLFFFSPAQSLPSLLCLFLFLSTCLSASLSLTLSSSIYPSDCLSVCLFISHSLTHFLCVVVLCASRPLH